MFSTVVRGGKAFSAKQKLTELETRIFRLKAMEKRLSKKSNSYELIKNSVENINSLPSKNYKQATTEIEKKINSEVRRKKKDLTF